MRVLAISLFFISCCIHAQTKIAVGNNEIRANIKKIGEIKLNLESSPSTLSQCPAWRWGAEMICPKLIISKLQVVVGKEELFIPMSAFFDLGEPSTFKLSPDQSGFVIHVKGGDAATSYVAELKFTKSQLKYRRVRGGEFPDQAWEMTQYSFPN